MKVRMRTLLRRKVMKVRWMKNTMMLLMRKMTDEGEEEYDEADVEDDEVKENDGEEGEGNDLTTKNN